MTELHKSRHENHATRDNSSSQHCSYLPSTAVTMDLVQLTAFSGPEVRHIVRHIVAKDALAAWKVPACRKQGIPWL